MVETMIEQFRTSIDGQLSDKSRVTDHLLDVRLAAADRPSVVAEVDSLLSNVPGLTTVDNVWWRSALDRLERSAQVVPTA